MSLVTYYTTKRLSAFLQYLTLTTALAVLITFGFAPWFFLPYALEWDTGTYRPETAFSMTFMILLGLVLVYWSARKLKQKDARNFNLHFASVLGSALLLAPVLLFFTTSYLIGRYEFVDNNTSDLYPAGPTVTQLLDPLSVMLVVVAILIAFYVVVSVLTVWSRRRAVLSLVNLNDTTDMAELVELLDMDLLDVKRVLVDLAASRKIHGTIKDSTFVSSG